MSKKFIFKIIFALYIGFAVFRLLDPTLKWQIPAPTPIPVVEGSPIEIKIPKIGLDLAISPSVLKGNDWQLYDDRIAWLSTSAIPGKGNTILYGHDRQGLLGDLYKLKVGDEIDIYDNVWLKFRVTQTHAVSPTDTNAVFSDKNHITIYTCEGSFDQKRLVVYAE